jgi:hypothetical protein
MVGVTPDITAEMVTRAKSDFRYFCKTFLKIKPKKEIQGPDAGLEPLIPFVWNEAQELVWDVMLDMMKNNEPIYLVICKARQFGISTFFMAWTFWNLWRRKYTNAGLAASMRGTADGLIETFNIFYESMPEGVTFNGMKLRPELRSKKAGARINKDESYWDDRKCSLTTAVAKKNAFRGQNLDIAICTEVAAYEDAPGFFEGFIPAMNINRVTTLVMESTPQDGWFRTKFNSAERREGGYREVFLPWWIMPSLYSREVKQVGSGKNLKFIDVKSKKEIHFDADEKEEWRALNKLAKKMKRPSITAGQMYWRQLQIAQSDGDIEVFNQEFPRDAVSCFMRSTQSAFKNVMPTVTATVEAANEECPDFEIGTLESSNYVTPGDEDIQVTFHPEKRDGYIDQERHPGLHVYKFPVPGYTYCIGADVADDLNQTGDLDDESAYSVGSVYCCDTREQVAEWRGKLEPYDFGDELAKLGYFYNTAMLNVEINNMGGETVNRLTMNLFYPNIFRWPKFDEAGVLSKKEHWYTDVKTKRILISAFKVAIREHMYIVRSPGLEQEMMSYVAKNGIYQCTDQPSDRIIAAALSWQCIYTNQLGYDFERIVLGAMPATRALDGYKKTVNKTVNVDRKYVPRENAVNEYLRSGIEDKYGRSHNSNTGESNWIDDLFEGSSLI